MAIHTRKHTYMKKVNITKITAPEQKSIYTERKKYGVYLGNNLKASFSNEKKAKQLLTNVNKALNFALVDLNIIYIELFNEWRRAWFSLPDQIENSFTIISKNFRLSVSNNYENGNFYPFLHINSICMEALGVCGKLKEYYINNKEYISANIIKSLEKRINFIISQIDQAGK